MRKLHHVVASIVLCSCSIAGVTPTHAAETSALSKLVINAPSTQGLEQMLAEKDTWMDARSALGGFVLVEGNFKALSADQKVDDLVQNMQHWNLTLDLEVGAVKEWCRTGRECFAKQVGWWDAIYKHGLSIGSFSMDEPRHKMVIDLHGSEDTAIEQVAQFVTSVRQRYPHALIGDIETYPTQPVDDHIHWIDRLQQRLRQLGDQGLDYYRIDPNWADMVKWHHGSWAGIKAIEDHCHAQHIKFSLIYWASDFAIEKAAGHLNDQTWYDGIMTEGEAYASTGAIPDQYVIETWIGLPKTTLPDSGAYTFTRSVRDFGRRFVR